MSGKDTMIPDAMRFTAELRENNNRDWWQANKARYDDGLKAPAMALLERLSGPLEELTGHPATPKLFRPHRDVRFSKDKTPYHTHLHMLWSLAAGGRQDPVIFFGIDPEKVTVGAGVMQFEKDVLADWRRLLDLDAARFGTALDAAWADGWSFWEPALKRVPPPYPKAHPMAEHLRRKGLVLHRPVDPASDPDQAILDAARSAHPVLSLLDSVL